MKTENIQSLISAISDNNTEAASTAFKDIVMNKVIMALDVKKIELASTVYDKPQ